MKAYKILIGAIIIILYSGCNQDTIQEILIPVPNGDFELWDPLPVLNIWQTNSCPPCVPAYETYIVKQVSGAPSGLFAANFIYNNVYPSFATNKFSISQHPDFLRGYIKSNISSGDTASIDVDLYSGNNIVGSGNFFETTSNSNYRKIEIPITPSTTAVDFASIRIEGGKKQNTELFVDNLVLVKAE